MRVRVQLGGVSLFYQFLLCIYCFVITFLFVFLFCHINLILISYAFLSASLKLDCIFDILLGITLYIPFLTTLLYFLSTFLFLLSSPLPPPSSLYPSHPPSDTHQPPSSPVLMPSHLLPSLPPSLSLPSFPLPRLVLHILDAKQSPPSPLSCPPTAGRLLA